MFKKLLMSSHSLTNGHLEWFTFYSSFLHSPSFFSFEVNFSLFFDLIEKRETASHNGLYPIVGNYGSYKTKLLENHSSYNAVPW